MTVEQYLRLLSVIDQAFADPYPKELDPPATGRIAWRKAHLITLIKKEFELAD